MDVFPEVKVKTLSNLAYHLGVMKNESEAEIEDVEFADFWDDPQKRAILRQFSLNSARKVQGCANLLLDFAYSALQLGKFAFGSCNDCGYWI